MMPVSLHQNRKLQLAIGFAAGFLFGFLLQKGGVTRYDVIIGQLLLKDFTMVKVMLSAVVTGMIGVHLLRTLGLVALHPKAGSFGSVVPGGLIFGVGFGLLGYCPGTLAGAAGQGSLDALLGGIAGVLLGAAAFAQLYPKLERVILGRGDFGEMTLPRLLRANPWRVVPGVAVAIIALLVWMEKSGL